MLDDLHEVTPIAQSQNITDHLVAGRHAGAFGFSRWVIARQDIYHSESTESHSHNGLEDDRRGCDRYGSARFGDCGIGLLGNG